jgi:hypothetical protein
LYSDENPIYISLFFLFFFFFFLLRKKSSRTVITLVASDIAIESVEPVFRRTLPGQSTTAGTVFCRFALGARRIAASARRRIQRDRLSRDTAAATRYGHDELARVSMALNRRV